MDQTSNFREVIKSLMDQGTPFPPTMLYRLSDLNKEELGVLRESWSEIPLARRRSLMEDLVEFSESDYLLMFEEVGKIALDDADPEVLIFAMDLLFQAEDNHLVPIFINFLAYPSTDEKVRAASANALGPYVFLGEIEELSPKLLQTIEEALLKATSEDPSDLVRRRALESLGYSSRKEVPALLRSASARSEAAWVESAMFAMGKSCNEQWQELVLEHFDHEDLNVRLQAIHAAGELTLHKARPRLLKLLNQELNNTDLRHEAIWALSQIGGKGVEELFERLLAETEDEEEVEWLEEAVDELAFTNEKEIFNMLNVDFQEDIVQELLSHHHDIENSEEGEESDDEDEEEYSDDSDDFKDEDAEEWQRYIDDDDLEPMDGESYEIEDDEADDEGY